MQRVRNRRVGTTISVSESDITHTRPYASQQHALLSHSPVVDLSTSQPDYSNSSIYQAASVAWVFGAGTISWSWTLDKAGVVDSRLQKTTANILNRFVAAPPPSQR